MTITFLQYNVQSLIANKNNLEFLLNHEN